MSMPSPRDHWQSAAFRPKATPQRSCAACRPSAALPTAEPIDQSTVVLTVPAKSTANIVSFLTEIEQLQVEPDLPARIVIDERSGVVVIGRDVRVSTVAVAQGNLTVTV